MIGSLQGWSPAKRRKIRDTFLSFCDIVLSYTQYSSARSQVYVRYLNLSMLIFLNAVSLLRIAIVVLLVLVPVTNPRNNRAVVSRRFFAFVENGN